MSSDGRYRYWNSNLALTSHTTPSLNTLLSGHPLPLNRAGSSHEVPEIASQRPVAGALGEFAQLSFMFSKYVENSPLPLLARKSPFICRPREVQILERI